MIRKYLTWALGAFIIFYLLKDPAGAATTVNHGMGFLGDAGRSLSVFVNNLGG
jgi:hypothetical protein